MSRTPRVRGLSPAQQRILRRVFTDAIEYQESLLGTYYTEIDPDDVQRMRVPRALQPDARRVQAEITRFTTLRARLLPDGDTQ